MSKNKKKKSTTTNTEGLTWIFGPVPHDEVADAKCCLCGHDVIYWSNAFYSPKVKGERTYAHSHCYRDEMGTFEPEVEDPSLRPSPRELCKNASEVINRFMDYMVLDKSDLPPNSPIARLWEAILDLDHSSEKFRAQHLAFEKRGHTSVNVYSRKTRTTHSTSKSKGKFKHQPTHKCPQTGKELCERNVCSDHENILAWFAQTGHLGQKIEHRT